MCLFMLPANFSLYVVSAATKMAAPTRTTMFHMLTSSIEYSKCLFLYEICYKNKTRFMSKVTTITIYNLQSFISLQLGSLTTKLKLNIVPK